MCHPQESRLKVYKAFKEGSKRILVATDLVGRGIDIERVNIVINYDMPETTEVREGPLPLLRFVCCRARLSSAITSSIAKLLTPSIT